MPIMCSICKSVNVETYNKLLKDGKSPSDVWRIASKEYNEHFSRSSFYNHLNHVQDYNLTMAEKGMEDVLKQELNSIIPLIRNLRSSLMLLVSEINRMAKNGDIKGAVSIMTELRQTISEIRLLLKELSVHATEEPDIFDKLLYCMRNFPIELIQEFKARWEEYEKNNGNVPKGNFYLDT